MATGDNWTKEETQDYHLNKAQKALKEIKKSRKGKRYELIPVNHPLGVKTWVEKEIREDD